MAIGGRTTVIDQVINLSGPQENDSANGWRTAANDHHWLKSTEGQLAPTGTQWATRNLASLPV